MASSLPSEDASSKAVQNFGLGPYDSSSDSDSRGEGDSDSSVVSLPDGPPDSTSVEYYISYPVDSSRSSSAILPGDSDRPARGTRPQDLVLNLLSAPASDEGDVAHSALPQDSANPAARADYYDAMTMGGQPLSDIWADEDTGAYAVYDRLESLPTAPDNNVTMDDFLGALGNSDSGYVVEDISNPSGFPSENFTEQTDFTYDRSNLPEDGGKLLPFGYASTGRTMADPRTRQATDIELVGKLTQEFLKEQGRKGIVRRHILQFLQDRSLPQFLASDIVRCMKHRHKIVIPDVMDIFPVRTASSNSDLHVARRQLIELEIEHVADPPVASVLRRCTANLSRAIAVLERSED